MGAEQIWTITALYLRCLNTPFIATASVLMILGETRHSQWERHLSTETLAERFGLAADICVLLREYQLWWLGHIAQMDSPHAPKRVLFAELPLVRPRHGPAEKRWRDMMVEDLQAVDTS